jgi:polar amino acid transport system substrate-binding protein
VKEQLLEDMKHHGGLRMLADSFMQIRQALVLHRDTGSQTYNMVESFLNDCLRNGYIADSMRRHGISGARLLAPRD